MGQLSLEVNLLSLLSGQGQEGHQKTIPGLIYHTQQTIYTKYVQHFLILLCS
jgi:hypothetical protein